MSSGTVQGVSPVNMLEDQIKALQRGFLVPETLVLAGAGFALFGFPPPVAFCTRNCAGMKARQRPMLSVSTHTLCRRLHGVVEWSNYECVAHAARDVESIEYTVREWITHLSSVLNRVSSVLTRLSCSYMRLTK